jgi:hypothetical protein
VRQLRGSLFGWPRITFFYWDDARGRRLRPEILSSEQALEQAKAFARAERDKGAYTRLQAPTI